MLTAYAVSTYENDKLDTAISPTQSPALPNDDAVFVNSTQPYLVKNETTGSNVDGSKTTPELINGTYGQQNAAASDSLEPL